MPSPVRLASQCALVAIAMLGAPSFAQQDGGSVLPPPSLFDEPTPMPAPAPPAQVRPAEPMPPVAAPKAEAPPMTTSKPPAAPEPMAPPKQATVPEPMATPEPTEPPMQTEAKEPWYKSIWPFGSKKQEPAAVEAAPAPRPAAAPSAWAARGAGGPQRRDFVYDAPNRVLRSGITGKCVKSGQWWGGETEGVECPGAEMAAAPQPEPVAAIAPAPKPAPPPAQPEPVEVQPLTPEPVEEPSTLESEPPPPVVAVPKPAPPPPPPPAPAKQVTTLSADTLFALSSYQLRPAARAKLDEFAAQLDQLTYDTIRIIGHTDPTGSAAGNERLSLARAESVKSYLVSRGVRADKILTEGMGSSMPMVTDKDCYKLPPKQRAACYQPDRRVEIEVSGVKMSKR